MNGDLIFGIFILVALCLGLGIFLFKSIRQYKNNWLQGHSIIEVVVLLIVILLFAIIYNVTKDYLKDRLDSVLTIGVIILLGLVTIAGLVLLFIGMKIAFHKIRNHFLFKELESISVAHKNGGLTNGEFEEIKSNIKDKIRM